MIHAVEILRYVALYQHPIPCVGLSADKLHPIQQAAGRRERAFVLPASVAVLNKTLVGVWVELTIDGPLHHSIPEPQRHDKARFWVLDVELPVRADGVCAVQQILLQIKKVLLKVEGECQHVLAVVLFLRGVLVCGI